MQRSLVPIVKDVVLVGAGHAHVQVLRAFGMKPLPGMRLTLITREVHAPYSGMLPGLIAGRYSHDEAHIDTGPLTRFAKARLYQETITGIDLANRHVLCLGRPPIPYDVLCLDIGSTPNTGDVPGANLHAIPVKPIDGFLARFEALVARVIAARGEKRIALVGAGAGGVELMLAVAQRLRREVALAGYNAQALGFVLVAGQEVLPGFPPAFRMKALRALAQQGIAVESGGRVTRVEPGRLLRTALPEVPADEILWTTRAAAAPWLENTGLALDEAGFLKVGADLSCEGQDTIFAAGDTASFTPRALPKSGVYAVRAGPILTHNIRALLTGKARKPYRPQKEAMYLLSTDDERAIGTRNGITSAGRWVAMWKDRIDRAFMDRFNALPEMPVELSAPSAIVENEPAIDTMRCGGCGAKVGAEVLHRALAAVKPFRRADVLIGLDAPDDAAVVDTGGDMLSVHTVDHFRAMIDDPYLFGRIAANHALGDLFAMGAEPQTALAIVTLPYGRVAKVEADLSALMQGANEVLTAAGATLVGGHTAEGAELALGFAVNGLVARDGIIRKAGMQQGDALVLTKALGTGTILAAHMRGKARARWVMGAIGQMLVSSRKASAILRAHRARAMTDVTGFGVAGHLDEMLRASGASATLRLETIPVLPGAEETAAAGWLSSLHPQNLKLGDVMDASGRQRAHARYPLLFDPQTAGGLLGSIPAERALACVQALREAGYGDACSIGTAEKPDDKNLAGGNSRMRLI